MTLERVSTWAVFTSFNGSLEAARPALERLVAAGIPVVPITTRTFAEMRPLADALRISGPVILESGGGIARRIGSSWRLQACGVDARALREALPLIEHRANARLVLYSAMRADEAAAISGLAGAELRRSMQRQFAEPFVLREGSLADVGRAAASLNVRIRSDARLHYLCGSPGEGHAARRVRDELAASLGAPPIVIALGGEPADAEFLSVADIPIILPRPDGTPHPGLTALLPDARIAAASGADGWRSAIAEIWTTVAEQANAS